MASLDNWTTDDYIDWMYTNWDLVLYPEMFLDVKFNDSGRCNVPCLSTICRALEAIRLYGARKRQQNVKTKQNHG
jgi:hypothetical protein